MVANALLVASAIVAQIASGAEVAPPTPETIAAYQPARGDQNSFWRYFFFWRAGATMDAARADLTECANYGRDPALFAQLPDRMPIEGGVQGANGTEGGYGLAGAAIFSLLEGGLERRITLANMRRCMGFKGYRRYGLSAALWRALNQGSPDEIVERLAAVATGPEPRQTSIAP